MSKKPIDLFIISGRLICVEGMVPATNNNKEQQQQTYE